MSPELRVFFAGLLLVVLACTVNWSRFRWYRRIRGGTWRHPSGQVERYARRKAELMMSKAWRKDHYTIRSAWGNPDNGV